MNLDETCVQPGADSRVFVLEIPYLKGAAGKKSKIRYDRAAPGSAALYKTALHS